MTSTDLIFQAPQPASTDLIFGNVYGGAVDYIDATIAANDALQVGTVLLPADVDIAVNRAPKLWGAINWQDGTHVVSDVVDRFERKPTQQADVGVSVESAVSLDADRSGSWIYANRVPVVRGNRYENATRRSVRTTLRHERMSDAVRVTCSASFGEGAGIGSSVSARWIYLDPSKRPARSLLWEEAKRLSRSTKNDFSVAARKNLDSKTLRWENATWLRAGKSPHNTGGGGGTVTPPYYTPPLGNAVHLLFKDRQPASRDLLFGKGQTPSVPTGAVVVPIKRAYIVINNVNLRLVGSQTELPCYGLSMNLDADSWAWSFNASLHKEALPWVQPNGYGNPVELEIEINGAFYRMYAESISRDRQFGTSRISVAGRGKSAILSDPYAPVMNFGNSQVRNAQQLMNDVLMENGVSIGWTVDWGITDWPVPAGVFSHRGTYMSALKAIADSVGAYIQPDPVLDTLYVKPRYPVAPWDLATVTPDFDLPAAVTARESVVWLDKPEYNGVYVSGTSDGVIALVKRTGTAGDVLAPMTADPLITHADAARQRGLSILGNTGRVANVGLELPVLPQTGIITPGKIIKYTDGSDVMLGIARGVSVNYNSPQVRQRIEVETHVF